MIPKKTVTISVHDGVIFYETAHGENQVAAPEADRIAQANGERYAEPFVEKYDDATMLLDADTLKRIRRYFILPESQDDCAFPTTPEPIAPWELGEHFHTQLEGWQQQGYFSNCRQERIPIAELSFRIVPENDLGGCF